MEPYPKIQSVFLRDPANNHKTFLDGQYSMPEFEYLADLEWLWTEKIDGTNIRVGWSGEDVRFGGRTDNSQIPAPLIAHLQDVFRAPVLASDFSGPATLYGEGYGAGIQKGGGLYRPDAGFILFDVFCGGVWLERESVEDIAINIGIPCVPIVGAGTLQDAIDNVAAGFRSLVPGADEKQAEGLVMRPPVTLLTRIEERIITKVKHKDFHP